MQLTFKNAAGVSFSFDPQAQQWTAREEGEKPTASQDLSSLTTRLSKRAKAKTTPVVKREPLSMGLAGIPVVHNNQGEWTLRVAGLDTKLDWDEKAEKFVVVRYKQTTKDASWESARQPLALLSPELFEADDVACFKSVVRHAEIQRLLAQGERALAQAWVAHVPVVSQLMEMDGRSEKFNAEGLRTVEPQAITWSPTRPQEHSNRNKVVLSPEWPVLTATPTPVLTDAELAEWTDEGLHGWRHSATGVRLVIKEVSDLYAKFEVRRPTSDGEQVVYADSTFLEVFRLAQATVQVVQAAHAPVEEWGGVSASWADSGQRRPMWPDRTFTEACVMMFPVTSEGISSEKQAYALRRTEKEEDPTVVRGYRADKPTHAMWDKCSGQQSVTFRPVTPQDAAILDARQVLRTQAAQLIETTQSHRASMESRMKRLHDATVAKAYQDHCDGVTQTLTEATHRLNLFFERLTARVREEPALKALETHVLQLEATPRAAPPVQVDQEPEPESTVTSGLRRQAAPARRRPR